MKKRFSILFVILAVIAVRTTADVITIAADEWLPFCGTEQEQNGYIVEIAKIVFEKYGHIVEYKNAPWARVVANAESGVYTGISGAYTSDAPTFIYPTEEQGVGIDAFYVLNDSAWKFTTYDDLSLKTLAVIQNYSYNEKMDAYIEKNIETGKVVKIFGAGNLNLRLIRMLQQKRVDVFIENINVTDYTMKLNNVTDVKAVGMVSPPRELYIGFSPNNPNSVAYAKILSDGMIQIRKSGELKKILDKYGVKDWK